MSIIALSNLAAFSIQGPDREKFLQGQLTCDLQQLVPGKVLRGAHCNRSGRVIALFDLIKHQDEIILVTLRELLPQALAGLKHYGMFSKLAWQDLSTSLAIYGIIGPPSQALQASSGRLSLTSISDHYLLLCDQEEAPIVANTDSALWYYHQLKAYQAFLTPATVGKFLPQELGLISPALSFTKGCYLGQEVIARIHYRGQLKRELQYLSCQHQFEPLAEIVSQQQSVGEVVCSTVYQGCCHLLALVDKDWPHPLKLDLYPLYLKLRKL